MKAFSSLHVVDAVQRVGGASPRHSVHAGRDCPDCSCTGCSLRSASKSGRDRPRDGLDELREDSAIQWQIGDILLTDDLAK